MQVHSLSLKAPHWFLGCLGRGWLGTWQRLEVHTLLWAGADRGAKRQVLGAGCSDCYRLQQKCLFPVKFQQEYLGERDDVQNISCLQIFGLWIVCRLKSCKTSPAWVQATWWVGQQPLSMRDGASASVLPLRTTCATARQQTGCTWAHGTYRSLVSQRECCGEE